MRVKEGERGRKKERVGERKGEKDPPMFHIKGIFLIPWMLLTLTSVECPLV